MCGRYVLQSDPAGLARYFETSNPVPNFAPARNVAPTTDRPVVRRNPETGARHLDVLRWGLVPRWARDATGAATTTGTVGTARPATRSRIVGAPSAATTSVAPKRPVAASKAGAPSTETAA